jgi:hypothetical protein
MTKVRRLTTAAALILVNLILWGSVLFPDPIVADHGDCSGDNCVCLTGSQYDDHDYCINYPGTSGDCSPGWPCNV